jgi:hypothetical protein
MLVLVLFISIPIGINHLVSGSRGEFDQGTYRDLTILAVIFFILKLIITFYVINDATNRGVSGPAAWGLFIMFFTIIGTIFYMIFRPEGDLVECENCMGRKLDILMECPHCRYRPLPKVKKRITSRKKSLDL